MRSRGTSAARARGHRLGRASRVVPKTKRFVNAVSNIEISRLFRGVKRTWLTQREHLKLQNVTKGVQRLNRKLVVLERPMGKDDPRRVWSGFVAQPVNVFQSSQSCPWPKATKHRDIFPRPVQSGAKSRSWRSARPTGTFSTHPAHPVVARHPGAPRGQTSVFCGRHGAARQAHGILHRVSNATIAVPATTSWSAQANTGTRPCRQGSGMS